MDTSSTIKYLKENKPIKFFELIPKLLENKVLEKSTLLGLPKEVSNEVIKINNKAIDKTIKSEYNIRDIALGMLIFIVGGIVASKIQKENKEEK